MQDSNQPLQQDQHQAGDQHQDLPASPVDLVIDGLNRHKNPMLSEQTWYQSAADWADRNQAPVLSISEQHQAVEDNRTLSLGLPLPLSGRETILYHIGIPKMVFQKMGIRYHLTSDVNP